MSECETVFQELRQSETWTERQSELLVEIDSDRREAADSLMLCLADADRADSPWRQVAAWLGVSEQWMEIARHKGYGPKFIRLSPRRIRYRRDEVLKFLQQRTRARTNEYLERAGA